MPVMLWGSLHGVELQLTTIVCSRGMLSRDGRPARICGCIHAQESLNRVLHQM